jgi:hypothetical protein
MGDFPQELAQRPAVGLILPSSENAIPEVSTALGTSSPVCGVAGSELGDLRSVRDPVPVQRPPRLLGERVEPDRERRPGRLHADGSSSFQHRRDRKVRRERYPVHDPRHAAPVEPGRLLHGPVGDNLGDRQLHPVRPGILSDVRLVGPLQQTSANPLPATATYAALGQSYWPLFGLSCLGSGF